MALLMSAGLFVKSLWNVSRVELGVKIDNVVMFNVSPSSSGYDSTRSKQLFNRLEEELASLPTVNGVTSSLVPLLAGSNWGTDVQVQGFKEDADTDDNSRFNEVGPGDSQNPRHSRARGTRSSPPRTTSGAPTSRS